MFYPDNTIRKIKHDNEKNRETLVLGLTQTIMNIATRHSFSKEERKDYIQEGFLVAIKVYDAYQNKCISEIIAIATTSIFNKICSLQSANIRHVRSHVYGLEAENELEYQPSEDDFETKEFISVLKNRLNTIDKLVLQEKICPSCKLLKILNTDTKNKIIKRKQGKLVMGLTNPKIQDRHICKKLKLSKATISRIISRIRCEASGLLNE